MGVAVRQVRSMVRKGTTYTALVPTVIGVDEEESSKDRRSGEASQIDDSKRDWFVYSAPLPTVW
jgi:hypothetical protein